LAPSKNAFGHHLKKSTIVPRWKKFFRCPSSFVCWSVFLKLFLHMSHYPPNASFRDTSSMLVW